MQILWRHSSALKPALTDQNKLVRFKFAVDQMKSSTLHLRNPTYDPQFNKVHIDEKWFHLMREDRERYILKMDEPDPT
jgi:hypothetical protein